MKKLEREGFVRTGELELRDHDGHFSMEFESVEDLHSFLNAENIDSWMVCDRKV